MLNTIRKFVSPQNAVDDPFATPSLENLKAAFGIKDDPPPSDPPSGNPPAADPPKQDPPAGDPPKQDPPPSDPPADPAKPPAAEPPKQDPPKQDPSLDKAGQAFAQLRVKNKEYEKVVNGVAKILGVTDTSNPDAVVSKLNELILKAEAKNSGVPEDVLKDLQNLKAQNQEFTQYQLRQAAYLGFQKVKDQFKLDDTGLNKFADELIASGLNPFETPVDVFKEYRDRHFNDLIQAAVQEGIRQEQERAAKAANHSSQPNQRQGQGGSDPEKITTVNQLTDWFDKQGKK